MSTSDLILLAQTGVGIITLAVLVWYTYETRKIRLDANSQNKLIAEQLLVMQQSLDFERHRETQMNRPLFAWDNGPCDGHYKSFTFVNKGGTMSNATVTNDAGLQSEISPKSVIASNQPGAVTFHWANQERPKTFNFVVEFDDKLNVRQKVGFTVSSHPNGNLNLPEPAASNKN